MFLWNAASEGYRQTLLLDTLRRIYVSQLMTRAVETVSPDLSVADFIDQHLIPRREQTFAVSDDVAFLGILSINHVKRVPRAAWTTRRVGDVMTPSARLQPLVPGQSAASALARLSSSDAAELPVIEAGQLVGFLGRTEISRFLQLKADVRV